MMKLIVLKGKYIMCCKVYITDNLIKYAITGCSNQFVQYGMYDGEMIHFFEHTEGTVTLVNRTVSDIAVFAKNSNEEIVAYGATNGIIKAKFDGCYNRFVTALKASKVDKSVHIDSHQNKQENNNLGNKVANNLNDSCIIKKNNENYQKNINNATEYKTENDSDCIDGNINANRDYLSKQNGIESDEFIDYIKANASKFYTEIHEQIEELFDKYPHNAELESRVLDSKWVNVNFDDNRVYVVGVISEKDSPSVICYGVPCESKCAPPEEIAEYCEWLPLDREKPNKLGYYIMYQNASNGEIIR